MASMTGFARKYAFAAASTLYLFSVGVASARNRGLIAQISRHFGFVEEEERIPSVPLEEVLPDAPAVRILEPGGVDGNVSLYELLAIIYLVRRTDPRRLLEIGTFDGRTTLNLAANSSPEARVFTLDLPRASMESAALGVSSGDRTFISKDESGGRFRGRAEGRKITQLLGDSARFDFTPYFGTIDLVFVDGAHSYEYVLNDSHLAARLLRGGEGTIVWHDYGTWPGVTRALNELFASQRGPFSAMRRIAGSSLVYLATR